MPTHEPWRSGKWPLFHEMRHEIRELEKAVLYLVGYDVAGWEGHMRPDEVLAKVGLDPVAFHSRPERDA